MIIPKTCTDNSLNAKVFGNSRRPGSHRPSLPKWQNRLTDFLLACKNGTHAALRGESRTWNQASPLSLIILAERCARESSGGGEAGKRLTGQVFSFNYLSLCILRRSTALRSVRSMSRRVDRWPVSPPQPTVGPSTARGSSTPSRPTRSGPPSLSSLRGAIDQLDLDLVNLLNRRAEIASQIGQVKHNQGLEIWSAAREDEVIARALAASHGPLPTETLRLIFRELMSGSRSPPADPPRRLPGTQVQLQLPGRGREIWRGRGARARRLDRRRLRGSQSAARPVRHRTARELDRWPDRRHPRDVHQAA